MQVKLKFKIDGLVILAVESAALIAAYVSWYATELAGSTQFTFGSPVTYQVDPGAAAAAAFISANGTGDIVDRYSSLFVPAGMFEVIELKSK